MSQEVAFEYFKDNHNLFITGGAGVGKSYFVKQLCRFNQNIVITSTTGISAMLIGGKTIHSWSGVGMFDEKKPLEQYFEKINKNKFILNTWKKTKVLVIDEISMMHPKFLDLLNKLGKIIRNNTKPFGGIQVILVGDFYQLPPIITKDASGNRPNETFCFEADCWNELKLKIVNLTKIFRQNEKDLMDTLNKVRIGKIDDNVVSYLNMLSTNEKTDDFYTHVFPTKRKVADYNHRMLEQLEGDYHEFQYSVSFSEKFNKEYFRFPKDTLIEEKLIVKKNCFVMCIFNLDFDSGIVNGSQGIIKDFCKSSGNPIVQFNNGVERYIDAHTWSFEGFNITQIPLIVAYSVTVHKMQGSSIDKLSVDIGEHIFECGQTYVALSRCMNSKNLHISHLCVDKIRVNKKVKEFYENLAKKDHEYYLSLNE